MLLVIYVLVLHSLYFLLSVSCLLESVHLCSLMYSYIQMCVCMLFVFCLYFANYEHKSHTYREEVASVCA